MKNVLVFVLLVVVLVLGFFLYRTRSELSNKVAVKRPQVLRTAGTKHKRKDKNGNPVDTQDCDILINNDTCVIPISYLRTMAQGQDNYALEVHHGDKIIWFGDHGESLDVQPLQGMPCPNSTGPSSTIYLLDTISPPGALQVGHVGGDPGNDDQEHDLYCYKTIVKIAGQTNPIDPHMFNAGQ